jgi:hypothetical protein
MSDPADRDGMFTSPRPGDELGSVVTCALCGCIIGDTHAHVRAHSATETATNAAPFRERAQAYRNAVNREAQDAADADKDAVVAVIKELNDRFTNTEHDAALYEERRGMADDDRPTRLESERDEADDDGLA